MGFTALHMLWLLPAFTLTTQELVRLRVSPEVTAECGKQVTLICNVSSQSGLLIKHMEWSQSKTSLCSVDSEGRLITRPRASLSDFHCEYNDGLLSLIFQKVLPLESGLSKPYMCKLRSNRGAPHRYTTVALQECSGTVDRVLTSDGPVCTFNHVHPDGDVHWFHGSHNPSDGSLRHNTSKSVDKHGWLTIHSHLKGKSSQVPYNCSLKSTVSGKYFASALVGNRDFSVTDIARAVGPVQSDGSRVRSQKTLRTVLCILILLAVTLT